MSCTKFLVARKISEKLLSSDKIASIFGSQKYWKRFYTASLLLKLINTLSGLKCKQVTTMAMFVSSCFFFLRYIVLMELNTGNNLFWPNLPPRQANVPRGLCEFFPTYLIVSLFYVVKFGPFVCMDEIVVVVVVKKIKTMTSLPVPPYCLNFLNDKM